MALVLALLQFLVAKTRTIIGEKDYPKESFFKTKPGHN